MAHLRRMDDDDAIVVVQIASLGLRLWRRSADEHNGRSAGRLGSGRIGCMKPAPESSTTSVGLGILRRRRFRALIRRGQATDCCVCPPLRRGRSASEHRHRSGDATGACLGLLGVLNRFNVLALVRVTECFPTSHHVDRFECTQEIRRRGDGARLRVQLHTHSDDIAVRNASGLVHMEPSTSTVVLNVFTTPMASFATTK